MSECFMDVLGSHGGWTNGQATAHGRALGAHRTLSAGPQTPSQGRAPSHSEPTSPDRNSFRAQDGDPLGGPTPGDGLWMRDDLLAPLARLAGGRRLGGPSPSIPQPPPGGGPDRLVACGGGQRLGPRRFWGAQTGPNPTDRAKNGSKHHVITDAQGIPLATKLTGANRHDVTQLLPLVDAIPPVSGKRGRPRKRPERVQGDRAYHSQPHREALRQRGIEPVLAERNTKHGSGLGVHRWVVERTLSWLHQFRRLRIRYERRDDIHEAFMTLGCIMICWRTLRTTFC